MGNSVSANVVYQNRGHPRARSITGVNGVNATSPEATPPGTATGQAAEHIATGLQQASQASTTGSFLKLIINNTCHILSKLSSKDALAVLSACNNTSLMRARHPIVELDYLAENGNRAPLPTVQALQKDLAFFSKTHPDKSISRHALGLILQLATQNTPQNTPPGSVAHPRHRLAQLAVATLEHLNDGDIQNINIKTQMNPEQLQQVIELLSNLPPEHFDGAQQTKIAAYVTYLAHTRLEQINPFNLFNRQLRLIEIMDELSRPREEL